jgi:putative transposase
LYEIILYEICSLTNLKHFTFRQRLIEKIKLVKDTQLYLVTEEYTSKTCTNCGSVKWNLGCNKIYKCNKCKLIIDRDVNGARNIFIKNTMINRSASQDL